MNYEAFKFLNVFFRVQFHLKMYICKEKKRGKRLKTKYIEKAALF